ncbi:MAG: hypothetical protein RL213_2008 [Bacteroidota bacterium]|jgi:hypothetical protein
MKTLIYFASGTRTRGYASLGYDKVYLLDFGFRESAEGGNVIEKSKTVTCIGGDCLESVQILKDRNVTIDCFVCLNEGIFEGGGIYPINSDPFLGYVMPLFSSSYIHIMSYDYYCRSVRITMDWPYDMVEIGEDDSRYINPVVFDENRQGVYGAKAYQMAWNPLPSVSFPVKPGMMLNIIHDTVWRYEDSLQRIYISFKHQNFRDFFGKRPNVSNIADTSIPEILNFCTQNRVEKIGFTPWSKGRYDEFLQQLIDHQGEYPKEVSLFHLNKLDYSGLRERLRQLG